MSLGTTAFGRTLRCLGKALRMRNWSHWNGGFRRIGPKQDYTVAATTGPLSLIEGKRVLVLADDQNLSHSARRLGFHVSYRLLGDRLRETAESCLLHAFFSHDGHDERRQRYFLSRGWTPHVYEAETVRTCRGTERLTNTDGLILVIGGMLISQSDVDAVIVASGDGSLVCDLAKGLATIPRRPQVITMSLAGSTSWRLNAASNPAIAGNIEIGHDCLLCTSER